MIDRASPQPDERQPRDFAIEAARLLHDRHCEDVRLIDVRGLSQVCDFVLLGTGSSDRQMRSIADDLARLGRENDNTVFRSSCDSAVTWVVVDFVDLVAHLFEPALRDYYDLESLWSDGVEVAWQREQVSG